MVLRVIATSGLCALTLMVTPAAFAKKAGSKNGSIYTEIRLNAGLLNGTSGEYVYDAFGAASGIPGYKVSQLDWTIEDVPMLGAGFSIAPNERLRFNADYWINAVDGGATMDDYDWLYVGQDWSHWSHHDNTSVTKASSIDINTEVSLFDFDHKKSSLIAILGYKQDHIAWTAVGGSGIYSINTYRDSSVFFSDIPVISYEQTFKMPYVGLGISSSNTSVRSKTFLAASIRFSNQVHGEDIDYHHLRDLRFDESGNRGRWLAYDIKVEFQIDKDLTFNLAYTKQRYYEIKTSTVVTNLLTGVKTLYPGEAAGLEHSSNLLSLGVTYQFR